MRRLFVLLIIFLLSSCICAYGWTAATRIIEPDTISRTDYKEDTPLVSYSEEREDDYSAGKDTDIEYDDDQLTKYREVSRRAIGTEQYEIDTEYDAGYKERDLDFVQRLPGQRAEDSKIDVNEMTAEKLNDYLTDKITDMVDEVHLGLLKLANVVTSAAETVDVEGIDLNDMIDRTGKIKHSDIALYNNIATENGYASWNEMADEFNKLSMVKYFGDILNKAVYDHEKGRWIDIEALQEVLEDMDDVEIKDWFDSLDEDSQKIIFDADIGKEARTKLKNGVYDKEGRQKEARAITAKGGTPTESWQYNKSYYEKETFFGKMKRWMGLGEKEAEFVQKLVKTDILDKATETEKISFYDADRQAIGIAKILVDKSSKGKVHRYTHYISYNHMGDIDTEIIIDNEKGTVTDADALKELVADDDSEFFDWLENNTGLSVDELVLKASGQKKQPYDIHEKAQYEKTETYEKEPEEEIKVTYLSNKTLFKVERKQKVKLFGLIPLKIKSTTIIDPSESKTVTKIKPWWSIIFTTSKKTTCGNNVCDHKETSTNCPEDCILAENPTGQT
ncbi:MAG: hypothetical protein KAT43_03515 [Nanoarchaeota archaeon]|nr:hypothetical protein [Nanoarchaeota archaeon]